MAAGHHAWSHRDDVDNKAAGLRVVPYVSDRTIDIWRCASDRTIGTYLTLGYPSEGEELCGTLVLFPKFLSPLDPPTWTSCFESLFPCELHLVPGGLCGVLVEHRWVCVLNATTPNKSSAQSHCVFCYKFILFGLWCRELNMGSVMPYVCDRIYSIGIWGCPSSVILLFSWVFTPKWITFRAWRAVLACLGAVDGCA